MKEDQFIYVQVQIRGILDAAEIFNISKSDFELMKKELPEMKNADRESWLELLVETVTENLSDLNNEISKMIAENKGGKIYEFSKQ